jgi:CO/xanthine dehydrogenase Mo-binding subunit
VHGGIIMGLGLALCEETLFDPRSGRVMNPSLAEYHVPVHLDVPEIDVMWAAWASEAAEECVDERREAPPRHSPVR